MIPGSTEFRAALLEELRRESMIDALGEPEILTEERVSRNTVIYRCRAGSTALVAKAQLTKPAQVAAAEYRMLRAMDGIFGGGRIRALRPVALIEALGVLVTREEGGESLRSVIERGLDSPERAWDHAEAGVDGAADALRLFHNAFMEEAVGASRGAGRTRSYLDFSTKNLLIRWTEVGGLDHPEIVLMDPPEYEVWGPATDDVGVFCFDLARIRFAPKFVLGSSTSRCLDHLKARFIRRYFQHEDAAIPDDTLSRILSAERRRAKQVLGWYCRPWRYDPLLPEIARLLYLGPLTLAHHLLGSRLSAVRLRALLQADSEVGACSRRVLRS